jgi:hypothetical protein
MEAPAPRFFILPMLLVLLSPLLDAQTIRYPSQVPKDSQATEVAGIQSYVLSREHSGVDEHGVINAAEIEAFGLDGQFLASCKISWYGASKRVTCSMADGGNYEVNWFPTRAEIRDLQSGDYVALHAQPITGPPTSAPGATQHRTETIDWTLQGTKTWEEVERDWAHITPVFAYLLAEAEVTLNIAEAKDFYSPGPSKSSEFQSFSSGIDFCDGETFCESSYLCSMFAFGSTPSACCAAASLQAGDCCRAYTGRSCCANSRCTATCPLGLFCECGVAGYLYRCEPKCEDL